MPILLTDILDLDSLGDSRIISGTDGLTNEVSDIMVMEAPDVENWSSSGQLILTSLYSIQNYTEQQQFAFIEKLAHLKISGLIIKIDRFVEQIPNGFILGSQQFSLPIIEIPNKIRYTTILVEVMQLLSNHKARLLNRYRDVHSYFSILALNQATIGDILSALESYIHNPISLCTEDFNVLATTDSRLNLCDIQDEAEIEEKSEVNFTYQRKLVSHPNFAETSFWQLAIPIYTNEVGKKLLIIHEINHPTREIDFMAIENAVIALQMDMLKQFAVRNVKQNYRNDLFDDLLYGKCATPEQQVDYAQQIGLSANTTYRVIVWQFSNQKLTTQPSFEKRKKLADCGQQLIDRIKQHYPNIAYRIRSNRIVFIIEDTYFQPKKSIDFSSIMKKIYQNWQGESILLNIGISDPCTLKTLDSESKKSLQIIRQGLAFLKTDFILFYQDLGIYRVFAELEKNTELTTFIPAKLSILIDTYPEWIPTLKIFLDENQNLKKTAEQLFVHYKTISYRLTKIKELTTINFADAEELLAIQMGLRIYLLQNR